MMAATAATRENTYRAEMGLSAVLSTLPSSEHFGAPPGPGGASVFFAQEEAPTFFEKS